MATSAQQENGKAQEKIFFQPNVFGLSAAIAAAKPYIEIIDAMGVAMPQDAMRCRELVKRHAGNLLENPNSPQSKFEETVNKCIGIIRTCKPFISEVFQTADADWADLVSDIRNRSPERLLSITDRLADLQKVYHELEDDCSTLARANAYGDVHELLLDTIEAIDAEEEKRKTEKVITVAKTDLGIF